MTPSQIVSDFLQAFMSGDVEKASGMVREDFAFRSPLHAGGKAAYFAGAAGKTQFIRAYQILRQWADGNEVSTLYELDVRTPEGAATMVMSEAHIVDAGQLASTLMVFDGSSEAVRLLGNAFGHQGRTG